MADETVHYMWLMFAKSAQTVHTYAQIFSIVPYVILSCDGTRFGTATEWTLTRFRPHPLPGIQTEQTILKGEANHPDQLTSLLASTFLDNKNLFVIVPPYQGNVMQNNPLIGVAREVAQAREEITQLRYRLI